MLGKVIKHEIINRLPKLLLIWGAVLISSVLTFLSSSIAETTSMKILALLSAIIYFVFTLFMISCPTIIFFSYFLDYRKRYFGNQGFLTHTLPVKTSTLMIARVIVDTFVGIISFVILPISFNIGMYNTGIDNIYDSFFTIFKEMKNILNGENYTVILILLIILYILAMLVQIWQIYAAYSLGHSHHSNKRLLSVVYYIALNFIISIVYSITFYILQDSIGSVTALFAIIDFVFAIVLIIFVIICTNICKKKLNLT